MKVYSPADIVINFKNHRVQGYAKGTFVKVARNSESAKIDVGSKGEATMIEMLDRSGTVTITVQAESSTNDAFSAIMRTAELVGRRAGVGTFQMLNLNGATLHHAEEAFLQKPADDERSDDAGTVEWTIVCANLDMFLGGAAL